MILVDSSVLIEYDRATGSPADHRLRSLITGSHPVAVCEPVVMEVVAGARDERRESELRDFLGQFELLRFDAATDFDAATRIHRRCRRNGITPRGLIDCMIAAVAWRSGAALLAWDADLDRVARVIGIKLDEGSLRS